MATTFISYCAEHNPKSNNQIVTVVLSYPVIDTEQCTEKVCVQISMYSSVEEYHFFYQIPPSSISCIFCVSLYTLFDKWPINKSESPCCDICMWAKVFWFYFSVCMNAGFPLRFGFGLSVCVLACSARLLSSGLCPNHSSASPDPCTFPTVFNESPLNLWTVSVCFWAPAWSLIRSHGFKVANKTWPCNVT